MGVIVKIVGVPGLGGLWAFVWAWQTFFLDQSIHIDKTNKFQLQFFN